MHICNLYIDIYVPILHTNVTSVLYGVGAISRAAAAAHWRAMQAELEPYLKSRRRVQEAMLRVGFDTKHAGSEG
jgi:hypothetical protein